MQIVKLLKRQLIRGVFLIFISVTLNAQIDKNTTRSQLSDVEKLYGLSCFWREASYKFVYFDQVPELDWDQAYQEYIPQVLATKSTYEYYRVMQRFCALLNDGHTHIYYPGKVLEDQMYFPPIVVREIDHRAIIADLDSTISKTIPVGSEIIEVDGVPLLEHLTKNVFPYICNSTEHSRWNWAIQGINFARVGMLAGARGSKVNLTIKDHSGGLHTLSVVRNRITPDPTDRYTMKAIMSNSISDLVELKWLESDEIAYVALNTFMPNAKVVDQFKAVLPELHKAKGIIIDLRANHGGSSGIARQIASLITADTLISAISRTRSLGGEADKHTEHYLGKAWHRADPDTIFPQPVVNTNMPVVVLIGPGTASGAEDFLLLLDPIERFTFVGQPTYGSTGQPVNLTLPGGGGAQICAKRDSYPDGREFVGYGIHPDVKVKMTVEALCRGSDMALEKGIQILTNNQD
ncbi:S41 family peptidase [Gemmatimonadota bacterium]